MSRHFSLVFLPTLGSQEYSPNQKNRRSSQLVGLRADLIAKSNYIKGHDVVVFQECFDSDPYGVLSGGLRSQCTSLYSSLTTRCFVHAMQMDDAHVQFLNLIFGYIF